MNYTLIFKLIGNMLKLEAALMAAPLAVSLVYGGKDFSAFLYTVLLLLVFGFALSFLQPKDKKFSIKDAFITASVSWLIFSVFGALPFYFSGYFSSYIDCLFESVSGFTTTGATILTDVEILPRGIVFWRSFSHWIGGMGVLVFILAVIPSMNASSINLLRAESTGPSPGRVVPRVQETARIMYLIYLGMTVFLMILLLCSGLSPFEAITDSFSVAGTGGFSSLNASVGEYGNVAAEIIMTIFMFLFGVNFTLYFYLLRKNIRQVLKDEELRFYAGIVTLSIILIAVDIYELYGSVWESLRYSSFQVSSLVSSTGFSTTDFNQWPALSHIVLIVLMVTGCCAGSTGGGIKLIRILVLFKTAKIEINKLIHPQSVKTVTVNGKKTDSDIVARIGVFFFIYFAILFVSVMLISIEGKDLLSNMTAVIAMLSNTGPGLGVVGPMGNYSSYSHFSKLVLSFCMLAGRLEFFPVLIMFKPSVWIKSGS